MSDEFQRIEVIPGVAGRRWLSAQQKLQMESLQNGETISMMASPPICFIVGVA